MRVAATLLAALAVALVPAGAAAPTAASGLRGVVMRGPISPVCQVDEPCEAPAVGLVVRFSRGGRVVARVTTGPGGRYAVRLRPGLYAVSTVGRGPGKGLTPRVVRVPAGRCARANFHLDTGIQ